MQSSILNATLIFSSIFLLACNSRSTSEPASGAVNAPPASTSSAASPAREIALPSKVPLPGVQRVLFGTAQRRPGSGGPEVCTIPAPLAEPAVFPRSTTELSYIVELQPRSVKSASTEVLAPEGQGQLVGRQCNGFTIIPGGFSQTQLGNTIWRLDKQPLQTGTYTLRITTDGQSADVVFVVK